MEYEESDNYSYEDDFESIEPTSNIPSSKATQERPPSKSLNYSFKDLTYKKSARSHEISKSPNRPASTFRAGKKTFQALLAENKDLRFRLKKINDDLSHILSNFPRKTKNTARSTNFPDSQNTRLQVYINEYVLLKNRVKKIMNPEHLIKLKNEIKQKETEISSLEKEIKLLKKSQKNRDKNLEKFWVEDFTPNDLTNFSHMSNQLYKYREQIENLESQQSKDEENYKNLQEKEEDLTIKIEKLQDLWDIYNEKSENMSKNKEIKDRVEVLTKKLKMLESKGQNRLNKLENQEKVISFELDQMKKEKQTLELSIEKKHKESGEYIKELQKVANNVSQNDMGHLLGLVKINNSESSTVTPSKSPSQEEKKRKNFDELFKSEKKNNEGIESQNSKTKLSARKMQGSKPKVFEENVIEENIPEEEESIRPKEVSSSGKEGIPQFIKPIEKSSVLKELGPKIEDFSSKEKTKSIFDELEEDFKNPKTVFKKPNLDPEPIIKKEEKLSFFTELEDKSQENKSLFKPIEKSSFLMELESEPPKSENFFKPPEKSSFLMQLEPGPPKNENIFKPVEKSIFMELDSGQSKNENSFKPIEKSSIFKELELEPKLNSGLTGGKADDLFKPVEKIVGIESVEKLEFKKVKNEENSFLSETEPKPSLFSKPRGRDRSHLFSKKEEKLNFEPAEPNFSFLAEKPSNETSDFLFGNKSEKEKKQVNQGYLAGGILDKMKNMAERAEKHEFFSDFYDKSEEITFKGRLLPTKLESTSLPPPIIKQPEPVKPVKPSKPSFFELEEEDINL